MKRARARLGMLAQIEGPELVEALMCGAFAPPGRASAAGASRAAASPPSNGAIPAASISQPGWLITVIDQSEPPARPPLPTRRPIGPGDPGRHNSPGESAEEISDQHEDHQPVALGGRPEQDVPGHLHCADHQPHDEQPSDSAKYEPHNLLLLSPRPG
jgi:hypothetical protein